MRVNREIKAPKVRVISATGEQIGILGINDALGEATKVGLDLVEIAPNAKPPVCKIIDYGKFRYQQTKKEKESKKAQHQIKVKEIKLKPNIDKHDLDFKVRHAKEFLQKGYKVRLVCTFRGREMMFKNKGQQLLLDVCEELKEFGVEEAPSKQMGRTINVVIAPNKKK